jgi:hypothetical protein
MKNAKGDALLWQRKQTLDGMRLSRQQLKTAERDRRVRFIPPFRATFTSDVKEDTPHDGAPQRHELISWFRHLTR